MITAAHSILYASDAEAARAFFRDVLGLPHVDAGHGWLIFTSPPAELAVHPTGPADGGRTEMYLMCDDLASTIAELRAKRRGRRRGRGGRLGPGHQSDGARRRRDRSLRAAASDRVRPGLISGYAGHGAAGR
ncbi:VOC family protein [Nocardia cyriacigeorgica]|uniref:VOC family protein n=1 Tax=Nocardia cyriacigeorgica TaxID=135487 RepID=UPI002F95B9C4